MSRKSVTKSPVIRAENRIKPPIRASWVLRYISIIVLETGNMATRIHFQVTNTPPIHQYWTQIKVTRVQQKGKHRKQGTDK